MTTAPPTRRSLRQRSAAAVSYLFTAAFWLYATERAVKTFAQAFAAFAFVNGVAVGLDHIAWMSALSIGGGAALLSVTTSLANYSRPPAEDGDAAE